MGAGVSRRREHMGMYTVASGDCLSSIADKFGFFWKTLWEAPENADLKAKRKNPNVLYTGDQVFIPDLKLKTEQRATEQRHRFRLKGVPAKLKLRLMRLGKPRANIRYTLAVDGKLFDGTTDSEGRISQRIPPGATRGRLVLTEGTMVEEKILNLGGIDPVEELSGVQGRLRNLGYNCPAGGSEDGQVDEETQKAIKEFQSDEGLPATGECDDATRQKLKAIHGC